MKEMIAMEMGKIKGSSMMVKVVRSLMEEGWSFTPNELDIIVRAEHPETGESISFPSFGSLKMWLYEKGLSY